MLSTNKSPHLTLLTLDSDIDLVVEFEHGTSLMDHGGLIMDLQDTLNCQVDAISALGLRNRMKSYGENEAVILCYEQCPL